MDDLIRDIRYGFRMLVKKPGFTIVAVLALALGIGANSAIFSVVNAVMLRPLPYADPSRLVLVESLNPTKAQQESSGVSPADFWDLKDQNDSFDELAALSGGGSFSIRDEKPDIFNGARVSYNFFHAFGVDPLLGRAFTADDTRAGSPDTVVLSYRLWMRRFGGDPSVVGRTYSSAEGGTTVIGVMPPDFKFPSYAEVWTPMSRDSGEMRNRSNRYFNVFGRIKTDRSIDNALTDLQTVAARLEAEHPQSNRGWTSHLTPFREVLMGRTRTPLFVLMGAVGCLLLIACTNVANLLLARGASRRREMAVRLALGARRGRLMRQLLTESVVLGLAGGVIGLLIAAWGLDLLIGILPSTEAYQLPVEIRVDRSVMFFTALTSLLTGIVFGLVPAFQASRPDVNEWLKEGGRSGSGAGALKTRNALIICEMALCFVLLIGAGLLVQSFIRLRKVDLGFQPQGLLTMWVPAPFSRYPNDESKERFYKQLLERVSQVPGVDEASLSSEAWFGFLSFQFNIESNPLPDGDVTVRYSSVAPGYFKVLGARIQRGRDFDDHDNSSSPGVAIINETLATRYFPNTDPIGKRISISYLGRRLSREIVGVSSDVKQEEIGLPTRPELYVSYQQVPWFGAAMIVRTSHSDPMVLHKDLQAAVWEVDRALPVTPGETVDKHLSNLLAEPRLYTLLLGVFAAVALVLASVGIYGVISYSVTERTREIGIRVALGAAHGEVMRLVIKQGLILAFSGVGIGLVVAIALTRVMKSLLFGVSSTDLPTYGIISLLLAAVALAASLVPARRAIKVDPMVALRYE